MRDKKKESNDELGKSEAVPKLPKSFSGKASISEDSPLSCFDIEDLKRIVSRVGDKTTVVMMGEQVEASENPNGLDAFLKKKRGD